MKLGAQAGFHTQGDIWGLKPFVFMAAWGGGGWHNKKELLLVWLSNNKEKTSSITTLLLTIVRYSSISLDCNSIMRLRTITHHSCLKVSSSSTDNFECLKPILPLGTNSSVKLTSSPLPSPMKIEGPKKVRKASIKTRSNTFNFRIVVSIREQKFNNERHCFRNN